MEMTVAAATSQTQEGKGGEDTSKSQANPVSLRQRRIRDSNLALLVDGNGQDDVTSSETAAAATGLPDTQAPVANPPLKLHNSGRSNTPEPGGPTWTTSTRTTPHHFRRASRRSSHRYSSSRSSGSSFLRSTALATKTILNSEDSRTSYRSSMRDSDVWQGVHPRMRRSSLESDVLTQIERQEENQLIENRIRHLLYLFRDCLGIAPHQLRIVDFSVPRCLGGAIGAPVRNCGRKCPACRDTCSYLVPALIIMCAAAEVVLAASALAGLDPTCADAAELPRQTGPAFIGFGFFVLDCCMLIMHRKLRHYASTVHLDELVELVDHWWAEHVLAWRQFHAALVAGLVFVSMAWTHGLSPFLLPVMAGNVRSCAEIGNGTSLDSASAASGDFANMFAYVGPKSESELVLHGIVGICEAFIFAGLVGHATAVTIVGTSCLVRLVDLHREFCGHVVQALRRLSLEEGYSITTAIGTPMALNKHDTEDHAEARDTLCELPNLSAIREQKVHEMQTPRGSTKRFVDVDTFHPGIATRRHPSLNESRRSVLGRAPQAAAPIQAKEMQEAEVEPGAASVQIPGDEASIEAQPDGTRPAAAVGSRPQVSTAKKHRPAPLDSAVIVQEHEYDWVEELLHATPETFMDETTAVSQYIDESLHRSVEIHEWITESGNALRAALGWLMAILLYVVMASWVYYQAPFSAATVWANGYSFWYAIWLAFAALFVLFTLLFNIAKVNSKYGSYTKYLSYAICMLVDLERKEIRRHTLEAKSDDDMAGAKSQLNEGRAGYRVAMVSMLDSLQTWKYPYHVLGFGLSTQILVRILYITVPIVVIPVSQLALANS